jgi:NAD(P)-dependent dehydrogenase (short-subunit alcohol dehydrogenase family)
MGELDGQVVVLTGATRGIGKASAVSFARAGASLVLVGRSTQAAPNRGGLPGTLESVAAEIAELGGDVMTVAADLAKPEDVHQVVDRTNERHGRCDILMNNAAVSFVGKFVDVPARRWRVVLEVNLVAPVVLTEAFLGGMIDRGEGRIINVTSEASDPREHHEVPQLAYAASKAGLDAMSFGLAAELEATGVSVNILAPEVLTEAVTFSVTDADVLQQLASHMVAPEPYGDAVVWVARQPTSFTGNFLTNQALIDVGALLVT